MIMMIMIMIILLLIIIIITIMITRFCPEASSASSPRGGPRPSCPVGLHGAGYELVILYIYIYIYVHTYLYIYSYIQLHTTLWNIKRPCPVGSYDAGCEL